MQQKSSSKRDEKSYRLQRFKRAAVYLYAGIVIASISALVFVLRQEETSPERNLTGVDDAEVIAVLEAMNGDTSEADLRDIDAILPIGDKRPQPPATAQNATTSGNPAVRSAPQADPAWRLYAAAWPVATEPMLAIVIDDLGLSGEATMMLAEMPGPYTLSYLPYADDLAAQTKLIRRAGHELMVHLPMQPKNDDVDPGANALLVDLSAEEFARRLDWNLHQFEGFVGVNNHMGSRLTEDASAMVRVMVRLKQGGHLFLDSLTSPNSVGVRAAKATGVPYIARDIFLDNVREEGPILEQLAKAERIARLRGYAIAIGHPYDVTLVTLEKWRKTLKKKGIILVPLSQIVAGQEAVRHAAIAEASEKK